MDFLAVYSEAGMIGVVGAMFVFMVYSMNKRGNEQADSLQDLKTENRGQSETLENTEGMIIKLIARWNQSDDKLDRKFDALTKEINDLDNQVSEIKGSLSRVNGKH
jgi:predicted  nucleic acid-binding Zn-ribbon protein